MMNPVHKLFGRLRVFWQMVVFLLAKGIGMIRVDLRKSLMVFKIGVVFLTFGLVQSCGSFESLLPDKSSDDIRPNEDRGQDDGTGKEDSDNKLPSKTPDREKKPRGQGEDGGRSSQKDAKENSDQNKPEDSDVVSPPIEAKPPRLPYHISEVGEGVNAVLKTFRKENRTIKRDLDDILSIKSWISPENDIWVKIVYTNRRRGVEKKVLYSHCHYHDDNKMFCHGKPLRKLKFDKINEPGCDETGFECKDFVIDPPTINR